MVRNAVENQIITPPTFGEIVLRVINHVICAYRSDCNAVNAATGADAACSNVRLGGFKANVDSGAHAYSAKAPWQTQTPTLEACGSRMHAPNSSSPGLNWVTLLPTASTWPATSTPSRVTFRFAKPSDYASTAGRYAAVKWIDGGRANFYQNFIILSGRLFNLFTFKNVGGTVVVINDRPHKEPPVQDSLMIVPR